MWYISFVLCQVIKYTHLFNFSIFYMILLHTDLYKNYRCKKIISFFVMAPVTSISGKVLRSRRTGLWRNQRKKSAPPTRYHNAKRVYKSCNEPLGSVRKRKKQQVMQQGSTGDSINPKSLRWSGTHKYLSWSQ